MTMENIHVEDEVNPLSVMTNDSQVNGRQLDGKQNGGMEIAQTNQLNKTLAVRKTTPYPLHNYLTFQRQHINIGHS